MAKQSKFMREYKRKMMMGEYSQIPAKRSSNKKRGIRCRQQRMVFPSKKKKGCKLISNNQIKRSLRGGERITPGKLAFPPMKIT